MHKLAVQMVILLKCIIDIRTTFSWDIFSFLLFSMCNVTANLHINPVLHLLLYNVAIQ